MATMDKSLTKFDPDKLLAESTIHGMDAAKLEEEGFVLDAPLLDWEEGDHFFAWYMGWGSGITVEKADPKTGEVTVKAIRSHRFKSVGGRYFEILEAAQLNRKLRDNVIKPFGIGVLCHCARGGEKNTRGGNRVGQYLVEPNPRKRDERVNTDGARERWLEMFDAEPGA